MNISGPELSTSSQKYREIWKKFKIDLVVEFPRNYGCSFFYFTYFQGKVDGQLHSQLHFSLHFRSGSTLRFFHVFFSFETQSQLRNQPHAHPRSFVPEARRPPRPHGELGHPGWREFCLVEWNRHPETAISYRISCLLRFVFHFEGDSNAENGLRISTRVSNFDTAVVRMERRCWSQSEAAPTSALKLEYVHSLLDEHKFKRQM